MKVLLRCTRAGAAGGIYAGIAVLLVFILFNLLRFEPFATHTHLASVVGGQQLEGGADMRAALQVVDIFVYAKGIATFAALHMGAFVVLGVVAAMLFQAMEIPNNILSGMLYGLTAGSLVFYTGLNFRAGSLAAAPDWRFVLAANALAGLIIVAQLTGDPVEPKES